MVVIWLIEVFSRPDFASSYDWFVELFAFVVIGQSVEIALVIGCHIHCSSVFLFFFSGFKKC